MADETDEPSEWHWKVRCLAAERLVAAKNAEIQELFALVQHERALRQELEKKQAQALKRIEELEARLNRTSNNSDEPPSKSPPWKKRRTTPRPKSPRKRGGQPGHEGKSRRVPTEVDRVVNVFAGDCRHCGTSLERTNRASAFQRHVVVELPEPKVETTEWRLHALRCETCSKVTRATMPVGVEASPYGPRLCATVGLLLGSYRLSHRQVQRFLHDLYGVSISLGALASMKTRLSERLKPVYEAMGRKVKRAALTYADETGYRQQGRPAWIWVALSDAYHFFRFTRSRRKEEAQTLLQGFRGVLVADDYGGYKWHPSLQLCWAHLLRAFQGWAEQSGLRKSVGTYLTHHAQTLFRLRRRLESGELSEDTYRARGKEVQARILSLLTTCLRGDDKKLRNQAKRLLRQEEHLFRFLQNPAIPMTNNAAERALRPVVLARKVSLSVQSDAGARFLERIHSFLATAKALQIDAPRFLQRAYAAPLLGNHPPRIP